MIGRITLLVALFLAIVSPAIYAKPYYGASFSLPLLTKEPQSLRGYQFMLNYDPQRYKWNQVDLYFDGGFSAFSASGTRTYTAVNIYSIAPVVRYSFKQKGLVQPFLELSVGLSYLNHTRLENRNLGIHFAFQDRIGGGMLFGNTEKLLLGLHAVHYSNAHLSSHNSGITVPLVLDVGYRF
jgi:lipid A 3-O-deacylase